MLCCWKADTCRRIRERGRIPVRGKTCQERAPSQRGDALCIIVPETDHLVPTTVAMLLRAAEAHNHKRINNCLDSVVKARKLHRPTSFSDAG